MAFLLLLHEKMRLQRNYNKMVLRSSRLANRKTRIADNITKVQKMYSNKMTQLEQSTKMLQNQFSMGIQNAFGLGTQNQMFNPMNMSGYGITSFVANQMASMLSQTPSEVKGSDGNMRAFNGDMNSKVYQDMMNEYMSGTLKARYEEVDGKVDTNKITGYGNGNFTEDQYNAFMYAMNAAQQQQSQAQMMCQQMSSNYQMNVSVWLEAQKTQIEAEQDAALAPLEAEQTDIDLEQAGLETQMADAKARLETLKQACSEGIKESAPTFGLG